MSGKSHSTPGPGALVGFVGVKDAEKARHFYRDLLGLPLVSDELPYALVFDVHGTMLRVTLVHDVLPHPYTCLGWQVEDIRLTVQQLQPSGIAFEVYKGLNSSDDLPVWSAPGGARIAWFKDPDGNLLSLQQNP